jgi:UDP-glucose 4-epimerase
MSIVLVTGGAGFIGSHLVERLLEQGGEIRVLDNLSTGSLRNLQPATDRYLGPIGAELGGRRQRRLELIVGDVRDERLVRKVMRRVDCVIHLAAVSSEQLGGLVNGSEVHTVNVQGTLNVLQAATAEGVRRVVFGSCGSVYGAPERLPVIEEEPARPVTIFGASKLAGEIYCRAFDASQHVETVTLRYFGVYGPRDAGRDGRAVVPGLIDTVRRRRRPGVEGDGRIGHDLVYVDDAAEVTLAAARAPGARGRTFNVGSGQSTTVLELLDILNRLMRTDIVPRFVRGRPGMPRPLRARVTLAREILGWTPRTSLVTGLARCVQHVAEMESGNEELFAAVGDHEKRPDV